MTTVERIAKLYSEVHKTMCYVLEKADGKGEFKKYPWTKDIGSGLTRVMQHGNVIEKAGLNFSYVKGDFTPAMKQILGEEAKTYQATGISSIIHAYNPFVPTIHMNIRYFALDNGVEWFGGGIDLTPMYINISQSINFHTKLKTICDKYSSHFYPDFKKWADDYFFIKHRNETRGIGGIFFDRQKPSNHENLEQWISFTTELAENYPLMYTELMEKNAELPFSKEHKNWQKLRRGRYVEFNLVYDRGTKFGLETGGNTESILVSLPSDASWEFNHVPKEGTEEERTLSLLRKGVDWINIPN